MSVVNSVALRSLTACVPVLQSEFCSHISFLLRHFWDERLNPFDFHAEGFDPSIAPDNNDDTTPSFTGNNLDEDFYDLCVENLKHKWNINDEHLGKNDSTTRTGLLQAVDIFCYFQAQ